VSEESNGSGYLSKSDILAVQDLPYEDVSIPEWSAGKVVRVRGLTGTERGAWEKAISSVTPNLGEPGQPGKGVNVSFDMSEMRVALCTLCLVDGDGKRLFTNDEMAMLGQKSSLAINRVFEVAARLSGITRDAVEKAAKISGGTLVEGDASVSASPSASPRSAS